MTCPQAHLELTAYLDGELTSHEIATLDAHLTTCADCRAAAERMRAVQDVMRMAAPTVVPNPAPVPSRATRSVRPYLIPAAAAAIVLLVIFPGRRASAPALTPAPRLMPAAAPIPPAMVGLDCRVGSPGPGCQIETAASYCSSAKDCGLRF